MPCNKTTDVDCHLFLTNNPDEVGGVTIIPVLKMRNHRQKRSGISETETLAIRFWSPCTQP